MKYTDSFGSICVQNVDCHQVVSFFFYIFKYYGHSQPVVSRLIEAGKETGNLKPMDYACNYIRLNLCYQHMSPAQLSQGNDKPH